jgi:hypothetical protein
VMIRACQVYVLGTRKSCITGSDCRGIETSIRPYFSLRLFNLTTPRVGSQFVERHRKFLLSSA